MTQAARLVQSYDPPAGDPLGDRIRERAWTYDSAVTATARAACGDLDGAGALLDVFQEIRRSDGALEGSYDLAGDYGAGPLRSGNQAWVGLAALQWRALTCSGRHDRLIAGIARWLLDHRVSERRSPGFGLVRGGPDVSWASTEHNLEARAFFAGLDATLAGRPVDPVLGRPCQPGLDGLSGAAARALAADVRDAVARIDRAIDAALFVRSGGAAYLRQGLATTPGRWTCRRSASSGCSGAAVMPMRRRSRARRTRRCGSTGAAWTGPAPPGRRSAATGRS